ncbi:MAG: lysophospholipid acyltransferase family protein [Pseudodesulfovibrio sp.]|nr:lysophospholipid acyltransferase family protein [Pseudodesulfovibrio sp.]
MNKKNNTAWSSRSLASAFAHKIFYYAIRIAGRGIAYFMLFFVVGFYTCIPKIRNRSREYRIKRFGERSFLGELTDCFRLQMEFGKMLVDRAVMGILGEFIMSATEQDKQTMTDLISQGRGLILITGHVGCWQLGMSVLDSLDVPKAVVMYRDDSDVDKHYFEHNKKTNELPFTIIDPRSPMGGTLEMMNVLKKGGILCMMGDRNFGSPNGIVDVNFMNGNINVPISAYKIASAMEVPIIATFSHRTGAGQGQIWISRLIDVPQNLGRSMDAYRPYAQLFADGLDEFVDAHPFQFYNFFNMWKNAE